MSTATKTRPASDVVIEQVLAKTKGIAEHCYMDRDWIWYCGPTLQGEHNKPTREALKAIGFRFAPGGHIMQQDGKTRGSWGHSCNRPTTFGKRRKLTGRNTKAEETDPLAALTAFGL